MVYLLAYQYGMYTYNSKQFVTYTHLLEQMPDDDHFSEMDGVILLLPAVMNENIFQCKLGLLKKFTCLQVLPITKREIDETHAQNGMTWLVYKFYPFLNHNEEDNA